MSKHTNIAIANEHQLNSIANLATQVQIAEVRQQTSTIRCVSKLLWKRHKRVLGHFENFQTLHQAQAPVPNI
jgi:hypothetical protein